ncbi:MAG: hypothetical protein AAF515_09390 [Pseudomonadota bacterium]
MGEAAGTDDGVIEQNPEDSVEARRDSKSGTNGRNLKSVGRIHFVAVVAALTLFGAAHTWAQASGWLLATLVGVVAAYVAGTVIAAIAHEWGHYSGARLGGSRLKVAKQPIRYFFMFTFDMQANSPRQAIWMSWGGLLGSWGLLAVLALGVPLDSLVSVVLLATVFASALNASIFEIPVILRTGRSGAFETELNAQLESPGVMQFPGLAAGLAMVVALA